MKFQGVRSGKRFIYEDILKDALINSYENDNDIQLHIHSYNIPGSANFRWKYDIKTNTIYFDESMRGSVYSVKGEPPELHGATSYNAKSYKTQGGKEELLTKEGCLTFGKGALKTYSNLAFLNIKPSFFRAGGYDFGNNKKEIMESFNALASVGFLADSDISKGSWSSYKRHTFEFGFPIDKNAYYVDTVAGRPILEILPTTFPLLAGSSSTNISRPKIQTS